MYEATTLRATLMLGCDVVNTSAEYLGQVRELGIDLESGIISYVVLSCDGVVGMSDKWSAVPTRALRPSGFAGQLVLEIPEELLKRAVWFDKGRCPEMNHREVMEIYDYYGFRPYWQRAGNLEPAMVAV